MKRIKATADRVFWRAASRSESHSKAGHMARGIAWGIVSLTAAHVYESIHSDHPDFQEQWR